MGMPHLVSFLLGALVGYFAARSGILRGLLGR